MTNATARPDATVPDATGDALPQAPALAGTVEVFDPAMCCATGVCGPGVDPALLQIARDLRWLAAHGARVVRVGLSQEPQSFVANARVTGLMQAFGDGALPAVLVNDVVVSHGRYAKREELVAALMSSAPTVDNEATEQVPALPIPMSRRGELEVVSSDDGCCTPGSGCC